MLLQRLEKSAAERDTLASELLATAEQAVKAEDEAKAAKKLAEDAESSREVMRTRLRTFKEAIKIGSEKLQEELLDLLAKYGLVAPDIFPEGTDIVGLESFFQWLGTCIAMVDTGAHFHEDINAVVAVRTLSAVVYGLFPTEAGGTGRVTKAQLRSLRDANFRWPGEEAVRPETLPPLAKNIAKNFMDHFFKGEGRAIVRREVERMKLQVIVFLFCCQPSSLWKHVDDFWLVSFSFRPRPMPLRSQSSRKLRLPKRDLAVREMATEEMLMAVVEPPTEPRCPKTKPQGALLTLQLARCEGRGRVTVHFCVVINIVW